MAPANDLEGRSTARASMGGCLPPRRRSVLRAPQARQHRSERGRTQSPGAGKPSQRQTEPPSAPLKCYPF